MTLRFLIKIMYTFLCHTSSIKFRGYVPDAPHCVASRYSRLFVRYKVYNVATAGGLRIQC